MKRRRIIVSIAIAFVLGSVGIVNAFPQFNSGFKKLYLGDGAPESLKSAAKEAKCAVCHDDTKLKEDGKTKDRKYRNPYGDALDELLGKEDKKNKEKIREALKEVESQKAPDAEETYGERLEKGQLPFEPQE